MAFEPLTHEELAALDEQYRPFPPFSEWPHESVRPDLWQTRLDRVASVKAETPPEVFGRAQEIVRRAAAFDTGAIEGLYTTDRGLTMTVATQAAAWEQAASAHGSDALALFEAQLAAYNLVLDVATGGLPVVTEAWIRRLHEELTGPQETYSVFTPAGWQEQSLPRGRYKHYPNHVQQEDGTRHAYAPVDRTSAEMERFVAELNSDDFAAADPATQAAYAHYGLVVVHPFADGNGRVARALASAYLFRAASIPYLVFADQRIEYLGGLSRADRGEPFGFVEFTFANALAAIDMIIEQLEAEQAPDVERAMLEFVEVAYTRGGLTFHELDAVGSRLANELNIAFHTEIQKLSLPTGLTLAPSTGSGAVQEPPDGFRRMVQASHTFAQLQVTSPAPHSASRQTILEVFVSVDGDEYETIRIQQAGTGVGITLAQRDVHPHTTTSAQHRLEALAERVIRHELRAAVDDARASFEGSGYGPRPRGLDKHPLPE